MTAARVLRVLEPGPLTTVQDRGRTGWASLGVPRGGWLDPVAATLGNRLVGNPEDAAVLESLLGGLVLETGRAMTLAVTGGQCAVTVDGRPAAHGEALAVPAHARVALGPVTAGLRAYVAVAGGLVVGPVLGSCATDTLSWTGPPRPAAGDVLQVGLTTGPPPVVTAPVVARSPVSRVAVGLAGTGRDAVALRVTAGPRGDWFGASGTAVPAALLAPTWVVAPDSDRVALRLAPVEPSAVLVRRVDPPAELPSEGIVLGAVQVPPSGRPLVFLADHPTTGGYPVAAVVDRDDLPLCAHLRPGDRVRFVLDRESRLDPLSHGRR